MNHLIKTFTCLVFLTVTVQISFSQNENTAGRISPKELSIPSAPVFDLMGVTPSQINRTSDIKDFKVDWSFKSWKLNPNLAIQSQPVWELLYNKKNLNKYQKASSFMRRLASLDVSTGSVQDENNDRRLGFAVKMNLFREKDPLMEKQLYTDVIERYKNEKQELEQQVNELRTKLDTLQNVLEKPGVRSQLQSAEEQLSSINSRQQEEINNRAKIFSDESWNASWLDMAWGRIYTYRTDSAGSLKSLRLNRNTGWGGWINGGLGIGKKGLLTYLLRMTWYEEQVEFLLRNKTNGDETSESTVADNKIYSMGINFRYGGAIYTFFAEFLYERKALKTAAEAVNETFKSPSSDFEVVSSSAKWTVLHPYSFSIGGDWRISKNVIINYGMRGIFDADWKFQTFIPVATVSCMMR